MKSSSIARKLQKPERLEYYLNCPLAKLIGISNQLERYYYEKEELKTHPDGRPQIKNGVIQYRTLHPSTGYLKSIQTSIKIRILSKIPLPPNILGGVKKGHNIKNAKYHQGKNFHFCTDLNKFYPSVSHKMVYEMFIQQGFTPDVGSLLTKLTTFNGMLPQGTPTSTHIANLVFSPIDKQLIEFCDLRDITYTRYVDDLSFSSAQDFKEDTRIIIKITKSSKINTNNRKTFYKVGPVLITGVWAKNNVLTARDDQKERLENPQSSEAGKQSLGNYIHRVKTFKFK